MFKKRQRKYNITVYYVDFEVHLVNRLFFLILQKTFCKIRKNINIAIVFDRRLVCVYVSIV